MPFPSVSPRFPLYPPISSKMGQKVLPIAWLLLLGACSVSAELSQFFFAGNNGNPSTARTCPNSTWSCEPPSICAYDDRTQNYYCCDTGKVDDVCWGPSPVCDGTSNTEPSGSQQLCAAGDSPFCYLKSSSLASTSVAVNPSVSPTLIPAPSSTPIEYGNTGLAGGAIGGISFFIDAEFGKILFVLQTGNKLYLASFWHQPTLSHGVYLVFWEQPIGIAGFLFWRRGKNSKSNPYAAHHPEGGLDSNQMPASEKYGYEISRAVEVPNSPTPAELPATTIYEKP
ncbi:hypothetical protein EJ02DRAFT_515648 [Clathrospora elynae]|uniref:Uncharacterized protein n=1 Tax=Clathrospora elynae TaxID=706981 RepID=A0A6A5S9L9_9PLEO|nr:hypothetical protein EJ02DRAFT_515648 [Clathrospora elynae]